jgi:hypothetical protein
MTGLLLFIDSLIGLIERRKQIMNGMPQINRFSKQLKDKIC